MIDKFKIIEPSKKIPIKQYVPKEIFNLNISQKERNFKPGFKLQAEAFYNYVVKKKIDDKRLAKLEDAILALKIAENIINK